MQSDTKLEHRVMADLQGAYRMMGVRNAVRGFMTHNQTLITKAQQRQWFKESYLPGLTLGLIFGFTFDEGDPSQPLGYGLITRREGKVMLSGGLLEEARGKGYGRQLFRFLIQFAVIMLQTNTIWLDVYKSNAPARKLYKSLGFMEVEEQGDTILMRLGMVQ